VGEPVVNVRKLK